jgi:cell division protein FtsB
MGTKFVQNTHPGHASVKCEYVPKNGKKVFGKPVEESIVFHVETVDRLYNQIKYSGFTPISQEVYDALVNANEKGEPDPVSLFNYAVAEGWLKVFDTLPEDAQTPADALAALRQQVVDLNGQVADLQAQLDAERQNDPKGAKAALQGLTTENDTLKAQVADLQAKLDAMQKL